MVSEKEHMASSQEPPRHRLGALGKHAISDDLIQTAERHGFRIQKTYNRKLTLHPLNAHYVSDVFPHLSAHDHSFSAAELKENLQTLHQPLKAIAHKLANKTVQIDMDAVIDREIATARRPENILKGASSSFDTPIADMLETERKAGVEKEAVNIRENLFQIMRFMSSGSIQYDPLSEHAYGEHADHDDGCEVVANEMEYAEAMKNARETGGTLLPGFRFKSDGGLYTVDLSDDFRNKPFQGPHQNTLKNIITQQLNISPATKTVELTSQQLEAFCTDTMVKIDEAGTSYSDFMESLLREEIKYTDLEKIEARAGAIKTSKYLKTLLELTPEAEADAAPKERLQNLLIATNIMSELIDAPEMRRIWRKYNVSSTLSKSGTDIDLILADFGRLQTVIDSYLSRDGVSIADQEAIALEFRDRIAGAREILDILNTAIETNLIEDNAPQTEQTKFLHKIDSMLRNASIAPMTLSRHNTSSETQALAHYVGRHTRSEGIDLTGGFKDFVQDFGGEVVRFVNKNKTITTALGLSLYFAMSSTNGGQMDTTAPAIVMPDGTDGIQLSSYTASIDVNADDLFSGNISFEDIKDQLSETKTVYSREAVEDQLGSQALKMCHFHLPVKIPYFEHCLVSDQAVVQLQETAQLFKAPLNLLLDMPENGMDNIITSRLPNQPPFQFAEGFQSSLRDTGNVLFTANVYQNLSHAPWIAIAGTMGYKLGLKDSLRKTSGLISPLINGGWGLAMDNKYLLPTIIPASIYGSMTQGVSGAVMAATLASMGAYGLQGAESRARTIPWLPNTQKLTYHARGKAEQTVSGASAPDYDLFVPSASGILLPKQIAESQKTEHVENPIDITIAGETYSTSAQALRKEIAGLAYIIEQAPDKLGIDPAQKAGNPSVYSRSTDMPYRSYMLRLANSCLETLDNYIAQDTSRYAAEEALNPIANNLIAAEMLHLGKTERALSTKQKTHLDILGHQTKRVFDRAEAGRQDKHTLRTLFSNAKRSLGNMAALPVTTSLSLVHKSAVATATLGKMGLRSIWSMVRDDALPTLRHGYNALSPKTKGNIIGGFMVGTAAAITIDSNIELQNSIKENLPVGGEAALNAITKYSNYTGTAAGSSTATGLFSIYNFIEDHLIIHLSMGYASIATGSAACLLTKNPISKVVHAGSGASIESASDWLTHTSKGTIDLSKLSHAAKRELNEIKGLTHHVTQYDKMYLPDLNAE